MLRPWKMFTVNTQGEEEYIWEQKTFGCPNIEITKQGMNPITLALSVAVKTNFGKIEVLYLFARHHHHHR